MHSRKILCIALMILVPLTPIGSAGADVTCTPHVYPALAEAAGYYVYRSSSTPEAWEESNAIPGLQRTNTICSDGSSIPKDTCIFPQQIAGITNCLAAYSGL